MKNIQQIANMLTEDPDILCEIAAGDNKGDPRVRNVGTTKLRGNVATTSDRYTKALEKQTQKGVDPRKLVKEVQTAIVNNAKLLADNPEKLEQFLKILKMTINPDLLKIAAFYRKKGNQEEGEEQLV